MLKIKQHVALAAHSAGSFLGSKHGARGRRHCHAAGRRGSEAAGGPPAPTLSILVSVGLRSIRHFHWHEQPPQHSLQALPRFGWLGRCLKGAACMMETLSLPAEENGSRMLY